MVFLTCSSFLVQLWSTKINNQQRKWRTMAKKVIIYRFILHIKLDRRINEYLSQAHQDRWQLQSSYMYIQQSWHPLKKASTKKRNNNHFNTIRHPNQSIYFTIQFEDRQKKVIVFPTFFKLNGKNIWCLWGLSPRPLDSHIVDIFENMIYL